MSGPVTTADTLIAKADSFRDAKRFRAAAEAYRAVLAIEPYRDGIWVQLGNMLKDDGAFAEAEAAYRAALALTPRNADTHLQLGRALKLDGRNGEAFREFAVALEIVPGSRDVINEIITLGRSWDVEQTTGLGFTLAQSVTEALSSLRSAVDRIERDLPAIRALSAIPIAHYDTYRRLYRVPPPQPGAQTKTAGVLVLGNAPLAEIILCLTSLRAQSSGAVPTLMPCLAREGYASARALLPSLDPRSWLGPAARTMGEATRQCLAIHETADWIVLLKEPVQLDPEALSWIIAEGERTAAAGLVCDEDTLVHDTSGAVGSTGQHRYINPALRGDYDPELIAQGHDCGILLAVRRDVLSEVIGPLAAAPDDALWPRLTDAVGKLGGISHISCVLVSRFDLPQDTDQAERLGRSTARANLPIARRDAIDVVIPTRNGLDFLKTCVESLFNTAAAPELMSITVVDNQSDDPATRAWIAAQAAAGRIATRQEDQPFNWSGFNNRAVAATRSPLLLFLNNDIELVSAGWDDALRRLLGRPEVGVAGARLAYPDHTLQHAGIVLGINGATEHEGRGAPADAPGPLGRWQRRRSASAVTGAFLACRRNDFEALGGFDANDLPVWFSDVDYCLKATSHGQRVIYEPGIFALHHESKTILAAFEAPQRAAVYEQAAEIMRARWGSRLENDPWYPPQYARFGQPFTLLRPPAGPGRPR